MLRFDSVDVLVLGVNLPIGLRVDELELHTSRGEASSTGIALDGDGEAVVRLSEASLTAFLARELPSMISNPVVRFVEGQLAVTATARVLVEITVCATCQLRIVQERELWVDLVHVDKPGPVRGILEAQLARINPVLRASDLPIPLTLRSVEIDSRWLVLTGHFRPQFQ